MMDASVSMPSAMPAASVSFHANHPEKVMTHVMKLAREPSKTGGREEDSSEAEAKASMSKMEKGTNVKGLR